VWLQQMAMPDLQRDDSYCGAWHACRGREQVNIPMTIMAIPTNANATEETASILAFPVRIVAIRSCLFAESKLKIRRLSGAGCLKSREESFSMDSVFTSIHRSVVLLDLVDDAWAADCLSDDGAGMRRAPFSLLLSLQHGVLLLQTGVTSL